MSTTPPVPPEMQAVVRSESPTHTLVSKLRSMAIEQPKFVLAKPQTVHPPHPSLPPPPPGEPAAPEVLTSWKMAEHMYRYSPCPFPTLARGLFTCWESYEGAPEPPIKGVRRGLTQQERKRRDEEESQGTWRIVARGYDKFFNVGEVGWTEWSALAEHTSGPYELTLKANGCLILVSALTPSRLLVTSKHSLGSRNDDGPDEDEAPDAKPLPDGQPNVSHSERAEQWLRTHLKQAGKTEQQLARTLWEKNVTAVAELCDDSFEEHVLPVPKDLVGLVLHGLVPNSPVFESAPSDEVRAFALEWGLRPTDVVSLPSVAAVKEFCRKGAEKGEWEGIGVEGWVVRCHVRDPSQPADAQVEQKSLEALTEDIKNLVVSDPGDEPVEKGKADKKGRKSPIPPYPPGAPFFWKIKFEEPYLMYREWRELTKVLLPILEGRQVTGFIGEPDMRKQTDGRPLPKLFGKNKEPIKVPERFKKRPETRKYARWVIQEMRRNPELFRNYKFNRGIIEVRERFLEWTGMESPGRRDSDSEGEVKKGVKEVEKEQTEYKRTILVPVAIPGCGKTSVAIALTYLYGIGHTQSDDIVEKRTWPIFAKNVEKLLETKDVVFADRNNHLYQHRTHLRQVAEVCSRRKGGPVRLVALDWSLRSSSAAEVLRVCSERIVARGENHQSLRAQKDDVSFHENVLWQFIKTREPLDEEEVNEVVKMNPLDEFEENIRRGVVGVAKVMGWEVPSEEKMLKAIEKAKAYKIKKKTKNDPVDDGAKKKTQQEEPQYYGLLAEINLPQLLDPLLKNESDTVDSELTEFWRYLEARQSLKKRLHVTLWHTNDPNSDDKQRLLSACAALAQRTDPPLFEFSLSHVVCDQKAMSLVVDPATIRVVEGTEDLEWLQALGERLQTLHVTVGTKHGVKNIEGGRLVADWRNGKEYVHAMELNDVKVKGTVRGFTF